MARLLALASALLVAAAGAPADEPKGKHKFPPNRLAKESSPYLLQHAHNPVDWYPWGAEPFEKAKREGKLVFLSIGYCGWVGGHVAVDLLERFLDRPALRLLPGLMAFVGAALFAFIAVQAVTNALGDFARASNMLRWPHYPFRFTVAFGSAVFALVLLVQGIGLVRRGRE